MIPRLRKGEYKMSLDHLVVYEKQKSAPTMLGSVQEDKETIIK